MTKFKRKKLNSILNLILYANNNTSAWRKSAKHSMAQISMAQVDTDPTNTTVWRACSPHCPQKTAQTILAHMASIQIFTPPMADMSHGSHVTPPTQPHTGTRQHHPVATLQHVHERRICATRGGSEVSPRWHLADAPLSHRDSQNPRVEHHVAG